MSLQKDLEDNKDQKANTKNKEEIKYEIMLAKNDKRSLKAYEWKRMWITMEAVLFNKESEDSNMPAKDMEEKHKRCAEELKKLEFIALNYEE